MNCQTLKQRITLLKHMTLQHHTTGNQNGQSLVGALVALPAIVALFWAIPLLGRYQDLALQASHASRHAAFIGVTSNRVDDAVLRESVQSRYFHASNTRWRDHAGHALMSADDVAVNTQYKTLSAWAQPGGSQPQATNLRKDWQLISDGIVVAEVDVSSRNAVDSQYWPSSTINFKRSTALLGAAGHAADDADTQSRIANADIAWASAANKSYAAGRSVTARVAAVDAGFKRPPPRFDWVSEWVGLVPANRLQSRMAP